LHEDKSQWKHAAPLYGRILRLTENETQTLTFVGVRLETLQVESIRRENFVTKKTTAVLVLVALAVLIGTFTVQPVARAQSGCTVANLKGAYGLAVNGFFYYMDGTQGVYGSAGVVVADGNGAISGTDTVNIDGTPTRGRQFSGTYSINNDCTGTVNLTDAQGKKIVNMDLVITNGGKDVSLVDYDTDAILNGTAKLQ
jgi:hypothetical protein